MQTLVSNSHQPEEVNNHVHSTYSFSPYSPTQITAAAVEAGLKTVGLMDHDAIAGAPEFLEAARTYGIAATVGCEIRVHLDGTPLEGKRVNNPDEPNIIYIAFHGIPATQFEATDQFLNLFVPPASNEFKRKPKNLMRGYNTVTAPHSTL